MGKSGKSAAAGFTLTELMITIGIFAILVAIAVPSFKDASLTSQVRSMANALVSSTALARSEAIKRNAVVTMCVSNADGSACAEGSWEQGWIVMLGGQPIQHEPAMTQGFVISEENGLTNLSFQPIGAGTTPATFTVCRAAPVGKQQRVVTVEAAGRAWVHTVNGASSCP